MYSLAPKIQICPITLITLEIVARCRYYPTTLKPSTTLPRSHTANHIIVTLPHFARKSFWNLSLDVAEMGKNIFGLLSYYFKKPSILLRSDCRILPEKKIISHFKTTELTLVCDRSTFLNSAKSYLFKHVQTCLCHY